jgi:hypothetical protein
MKPAVCKMPIVLCAGYFVAAIIEQQVPRDPSTAFTATCQTPRGVCTIQSSTPISPGSVCYCILNGQSVNGTTK